MDVTSFGNFPVTVREFLDLVTGIMPEGMGMASFEQEELPSTASSRKKVWMFRPLTWIQHDLWPLQLTNLAVTLSLLAMGVLLGVVSTLHTMGYFGSSNSLLNPLNSIAPPPRTSGVYSPLPSPLFNVSTSSGIFNGSVTIPSGGASLQSNASIAVGSLNSSGLETEAPSSQFAGTSIKVNITVPACKIPPLPSPTVPDIKAPDAANNQTFSGVTYQNMSVTWHNMTEDELLWMASMAPTRPRGGAMAHVSKIAYMYITRGPLPFEPIWIRYFQGHEKLYSIYIHASPSYVPNHAPTSPFHGRFIPSKGVKWGQISVYTAERRLLGNALLDTGNDWFVLLSEACIPIDNFPSTYKYITESRYSFMEAYVNPTNIGQGRLSRGKPEKMAPEVTPRNFRKGSQWFQINRDLALVAAADTKYFDKFEKYFCHPRPVCYIDEHYLPTLFNILRPKSLAYRTLTYFEFAHRSPHPRKWNNVTTNAGLMQWLREGHNCTYNGVPSKRCFFFTRKFDPSALEILLQLATTVMGIP